MKMTKGIMMFIGLSLYSLAIFGQEVKTIDLIAADSTWGREHFTFPLSFAHKIPFQGVEEAVFPAGWGDVESSEFWSYAFAWSIDSNGALSVNDIEINLQHYFDGLLGLDPNRNNESAVKSTTALFVQVDDAQTLTTYTGKIKTLETRFTKKPMTMNVLADQYYCEQEKKTLILFRFSPNDFSHDLWRRLKVLKLYKHLCPHGD